MQVVNSLVDFMAKVKKSDVIKVNKNIDFVITNIVASANLGIELDLFTLTEKIKGIEYEPEQFPGAILKFKDPKASLLLFKNGKIVCVGCKTRGLIEKTVNKTKKMLMPYASKIITHKKPDINITNIVASADLHMNLDLYKISYKMNDVEYEPEQFPGAILKFKDPKASLLLFKNGRVICAGARDEKDIKTVLKKVRKILENYTSK